ncbi:MAG TPA: STAS domain-containing protein [Umezawaea sp.]|nr:STAS domain-containing protein [Umezawaea sp.]
MDAIDSTASRLELFVNEDRSGSPVVAAVGDIDINTVHQLHASLLGQAEATRARSGAATDIVLDLSRVEFFGSVALDPMLRTRDVLSADRARLHVVVTDHIRRSLNVLGLTALFVLHDELNDALDALRAA